MSLQIARGREAKPPLRSVRPRTDIRPQLREATEAPPAAAVPVRAVSAKKTALRFPVNPDTRAFYKAFYPGTSSVEWNDWKWQMRARIRTRDELTRIFSLSTDEFDAVSRHTGPLPVGITPYYASLMDLRDSREPLRRTHIMTGDEFLRSPGEDDDPLGEDHDMVAPGIVHRYPDRVLFLTTGTCSTYCRYCTRARAVGDPGGEYQLTRRKWEQALDYIEAHT
jgi:lysine 2,3-aminomutase